MPRIDRSASSQVLSLYVFSRDSYFRLGIEHVCEKHGVDFNIIYEKQLMTPGWDAYGLWQKGQKGILLIDTDGISMTEYDYLSSTVFRYFKRKLVFFDISKEAFSANYAYIKEPKKLKHALSKKSAANAVVQRWFDRNNQKGSDKVRLTSLEISALTEEASAERIEARSEEVPHRHSKTMSYRRACILRKFGFNNRSARNWLCCKVLNTIFYGEMSH